MVLDAVLADSDRTWLATEQDKLGHFTLTHRIPRQDVPALTFRRGDGETARYFPDKLPIGLDHDRGTYIFLYLVTRDVPIDFRAFLERHAELLRALPAWKLRLLVPASQERRNPGVSGGLSRATGHASGAGCARRSALVLSCAASRAEGAR